MDRDVRPYVEVCGEDVGLRVEPAMTGWGGWTETSARTLRCVGRRGIAGRARNDGVDRDVRPYAEVCGEDVGLRVEPAMTGWGGRTETSARTLRCVGKTWDCGSSPQ